MLVRSTVLSRVLTGLCTVVLWSLGAHAAEEAPPRDLAALDRAVQEVLESSTIPGASIVVIEDRSVAWVRHFGVADRDSGRPVEDATVFRAGSISKSLTGIAAMMLVEEGAIALDAPARALIPDLDLHNRWADIDPVRLVHLLEHTAGFNDIAFRHYLLEGGGMPLAEAVRQFGPYRSRWRPGTLMSYSNQGPIVAARMLELAAGESFEAFMRRRVTEPLGMRSASWNAADAARAPLASSYRPDGLTPERFVDTPGWPSGGLNVTALDLARLPLLLLGRGTLDGERLLAPASVERIEKPGSGTGARAGLIHGYGLGNVVMANGKARFHGHDGSIDGFVATFAYAPDLGAGYVIMANATSEAIFDLAAQIRAYLERDVPSPVVEAAETAPEAGLETWAGQYQVMTPRRALLAGLIGLTQWEGASFDEGRLRFRGDSWINLGDGLWQRESAVVPELVSTMVDGQARLHTATATYRRVSAVEMWTRIGLMAGFVLLLVISVPHLILMAVSGLRGRLGERGGPGLRLWPMAALYSVAGVVVYAMALLQTGDLEFIGRPTAAAWGLFAWSMLTPLMVVLGVAGFVRRGSGSGRAARALALGYLAMAAIACAYLLAHGWIGLRLWTA
ncbi:MAG: serine hydrolase domain-containing protein [Wenzhouxiangella sp.]|jgi:CubicO group peptidase (beta-lactamase class C family)|nr:serine hydrolase domain-containing protein [Wenzhouxiangella sp.]